MVFVVGTEGSKATEADLALAQDLGIPFDPIAGEYADPVGSLKSFLSEADALLA